MALTSVSEDLAGTFVAEVTALVDEEPVVGEEVVIAAVRE